MSTTDKMKLDNNKHLEDPELTDSDDEELEVDKEETTCLFCPLVTESVELGLQHLKAEHGVDFVNLKRTHQMDQYAFIKLINCIRLGDITLEQLRASERITWDDEKYLKPKEYETWLTYDYEEQLEDKEPDSANGDPQMVIKMLEARLKAQSQLLQQATDDMAKMRSSFQRVVEKDEGEPTPRCVRALKGDEGYFNSYDRFTIHHDMLSDTVRTEAYRDALLRNKDFLKGKDVLDVGCGTSILSVFASRAGAKLTVGVDNSSIIYNAMDILKRNNIDNVTLVKGRLEDTELPQKKFDVIISEWMGYFLLFEGMLDSVIYARDNHLKDGGIVLPNRCTMSLMGYGCEELYDKYITFWNDVYGLNMSNMQKDVLQEPLIEVVDGAFALTAPVQIANFDMATVNLNYSNFTFDFEFECIKDGTLNSFVGYFDTFFDLPNPVTFSTGPDAKATHWKQTVFFLSAPQKVKRGEVVKGSITCMRSRSSVRSLDVVIDVFGRKCEYYLD